MFERSCRLAAPLFSSVAVILGYGRIARAMAARLCAHGAHVMIGARRSEAREAARRAGVTGIMVTTGIYRSGSYRTPAYEALQPVTVSSLTEAVAYIRAHQK